MSKRLLHSRPFRFGAGLVVGIAVVGVALAAREPSPQAPAYTPGVAYNAPQIGVCDGSESTLEHARSNRQVPVFMPEHALAQRQNLKSVWDCSGNGIAFEFESGVRVYLSVNTLENPEAEYATSASSSPEFRVGVVRGVPASLVDPEDGDGTARGGVDLVQNGIRIIVAGDTKIPLDDLIDVTESLRRER